MVTRSQPYSRSRTIRATAFVLALGLAGCARTAAPTGMTADIGVGASVGPMRPSKILAIRPVSHIGAGDVSAVLSIIGATDAPRETGQELIVRTAHGRVLSVVRAAGTAANPNQTPHAVNEIPDS